jgi:hypothetical protein
MSKTDTSAEAVILEAQKFIDFWFGNPKTQRPEITIPAKKTNTDIALINGIKALAAERDALRAQLAEAETKAFNEGIEAAAKVAAERYKAWGTDQAISVVECDYSACQETSGAIRALKKGGEA